MANMASMEDIYKATPFAKIIPTNIENLRNFGRWVSEDLGDLLSIPDSVKNFSLSSDFPIKELAGMGDLGYGFLNSFGGVNNDPFFLKFSGMISSVPKAETLSSKPTTTGNISAITNFTYTIDSLKGITDNLKSAVDVSFTNGLGTQLESIQKNLNTVVNAIVTSRDIANNLGINSKEVSLNNYSKSLSSLSEKLTKEASFANADLLNNAINIIENVNKELESTLSIMKGIGSLIPGLATVSSVLENSLSQDWNILNSKMGNNLISKAYLLNGRDYTKDGKTGEYSWAASFVGNMLGNAGISSLQTMSPLAYQKFGMSVDFHDLRNLRVNDILIFKSKSGVSHMGFLKAFDPTTRIITMMGGNQGGGTKMTKVPFSFTNPVMHIAWVRRAWQGTTKYDVPISSTG